MITKSPDRIKEEFLSFIKEDAVDLSGIANFVKRNRDLKIPLLKPRGSALRICGQEGTVYEGDEEQLEAWKDYYLPERTEMEVIGAIDDFPCDAFGLQLVLLLGEDGRVFAYEDELLHLVAVNLRDLLQCQMVFPGMETFKLGECFEEPTAEEYHEMMESDEVKEMKKLHKEFRQSLEHEFLNTQSCNVHKQNQVCSDDFTSSPKQRIQEHSLKCNCKLENGDKFQCPYRTFHQSSYGLILSS
ncbi:uncharacterized protein [Chanodichthys erythropterus]|uniref:uncharacterized protein n=1 Tax=Chanodichthys erythropterus TaxID=933992 RepID=UPI00351ED292